MRKLISILMSCVVLSACTASVSITPLNAQQVDNRPIYITVPELFLRAQEAKWNQIAAIIDNDQSAPITMYWQGRGGYDYIGDRVSEAMDRARARGIKITVIIVGYSASMHALVPCHATRIIQQSIMMFHIRANSSDIPDHSDASLRDTAERMSVCRAKGIVNDQDIRNVQNGLEVYVMPDGSKRTAPDKRE